MLEGPGLDVDVETFTSSGRASMPASSDHSTIQLDGLHCISGLTAIWAQRDRAAPLRVTLNPLMSSQQFISGVARSLCRRLRVDIVVINCCRL